MVNEGRLIQHPNCRLVHHFFILASLSVQFLINGLATIGFSTLRSNLKKANLAETLVSIILIA